MEIKVPKDAGYALTNQFRVLADRVAFNDTNLYKTNRGYAIHFCNPWYTSFPVSCVNDIKVTINGYEVEKHCILFGVRGQNVPFEYSKNLYEIPWGIGEIAEIEIIDPNALKQIKKENEVHLEVENRTAFAGYHLPDNKIRYLFDKKMEVKE